MTFPWWHAGRRRLATALPIVAVGAVVVALAFPGPVAAHARLRSAEPGVGATLGSSPTRVELTFSETPDVRLTSIKVLDGGGRDRVTGAVTATGDPPVTVTVPVDELGDGVYTVSWRTVSSVDGHISAGSFVFGVGQAPPSTPPDSIGGGTSQSGSPPAIAARWVLYLGLMALIGAAWVALAVVRRPNPDLLAMAALGWLLTAAGTVGVVGVQWAEIGAPIDTLLSTSVGLSAVARVISLAVVGLATAALAAIPRFAGRLGWLVVAVMAAAALAVDVLTGHAAAGPGWLPQAAVQTAHGLGAAAWVGGLAGLLVALRSTPAGERLDTARRFSSWAGWALALVAVTGAVRALAEIGTLEALIGADYGRVVVAKSALLLVLAGLGAGNRFFTLRNADRVATHLRRVGAAEVTVAVAIIGLTGLLVNLSPPASAGGPEIPAIRPIVATGHDFGTSIRARLVAAPGPAGANEFNLALTDYDSGAPVDASAVELRFEIASVTGVSPSSLALTSTAPGRFSGAGSNLSIDGIWNVTATVTVPGAAIEVPMLLATGVAAQRFETLVTEGLPTIYVVSLGDAGSAQVYLDPGGPGQNELHVTFFDTAGIEQAIETSTIAIFPGGIDGEIVTPRLLEPGHFVATIDAVTGLLAVDAIAPLPASAGGGRIHLHVTLEVEP